MDIEKGYISVRTFIMSLIATVTVTISATVTIMTMQHASERLEYINTRLDKKTNRLLESIQENSSRITALESPNSDKKK